MASSTKHDGEMIAVCERLEERRLLVAFQLYVENIPVDGPTTVDYGPPVPLNSQGPQRTIKYRYLGSSTVFISASLINGSGGFELVSALSEKTLTSSNRDFSVTYKLLTGRAVPRIVPMEFSFSEVGGGSDEKTFTLFGNVLPGKLGSDEQFGPLTNATKTPSGTISARFRGDHEGSTLEQVDPYLAAFELTAAQNMIDLKLTGTSMPVSGASAPMTSGKLNVLLARDGSASEQPDGKLSIAEREASVIDFSTPFINQNQSGTDSRNDLSVPRGHYLLFVSAPEMNPQRVFNGEEPPPTDLGFKVTLSVDDVAPPAMEVRGPDGALVTRGATVELGTIDPGSSFTRIFSVKNIGESNLTITGNAPNVEGEFILFEDVLGLTIPPLSNPDTFKIKFNSSSDGDTTGTITIKSSNAQGGDFQFFVHGTITQTPPPPQGDFWAVNGTKLTISGTEGNDDLSAVLSGSTFRFRLNSQNSPSFSKSAITKIVINLLAGDDRYSSDTQLAIKQTINGGLGKDFIRGGKQADALLGGEGDDRMDGRTRGDVFDGGPGSDTAIYRQRRATEPVTVVIDELPNDGGSADQSKDNVLSSTEHIQGGLGNDRLTGSSKTNRLFGFEGDDTLVGLKGNDTIDGGSGANDINGGFGNDSIFSRNNIADLIDGGANTDSLVGDVVDSVTNVEQPELG